jgi:hypothetical protein
MNYPNNLPIKATLLSPITKVSPYAPIKKQRHKHYPGEVTKALLDNLAAKEAFTYTNHALNSHKLVGNIIYKQA